jgi:hypothetical protein
VDPFDAVVPVGKPKEDRRPEARRRSPKEPHHDRVVEAGRGGTPDSRTNRVDVRRLGSKRGGPTTRGGVLTLAQLARMNSEIAQLSYRDAKATTKLSDRKHASTSLAIHTDKLLLLASRPTQVHDFVEAESQRAPMRELGLLIADARRGA